METKLAPATFQTKTSDDGKKGEVTAFVSVYGNVDSDGDIVDPGFFKGHPQQPRHQRLRRDGRPEDDRPGCHLQGLDRH
jgi:hypothetical protein